MFERMFKKTGIILIILAIIYLLILIFPFVENVFHFLYSIILPFFISFLFAYMLNPFVKIVSKLKIKRGFSVLIVLGIILTLFILFLSSFMPLFTHQVQDFINKIPIFLEDIDRILKDIGNNLKFLPENMQLSMDNLINYLEQNSDKISEIFRKNLFELYKKLTLVLFVPVLTIYFIIDFEKIKEHFKKFLEKNGFNKTYQYFKELDQAFINYFKGLLLVIIILTIVCSIAFLIIKLDYSLLFAVIIGLSDIIPYVGPYIGGGIVCIYALTVSKKMFLTVLIIVIIIQLIESNLITPFIQSKKCKHSPILILFSFLIFGKILGFTGMILAVPLTSAIVLAYKYFIKEKTEKFVKL